MVGDLPIMSREAIVCPDGARRQQPVAARPVEDAWPRRRPQGLRYGAPASRLRPLTATPRPSKWLSFHYGKMGTGSRIPIEPTALM